MTQRTMARYEGKYLRKKQLFVNIPLIAASVLFWLVVITTYLATNLFARYTTSGTSADSARIMAFGKLSVVDENPVSSQDGKHVFVPGVPMEKQITVAFSGSNAKCFVFVKVETPGWVSNITHTSFVDERTRLTWSIATENWIYLSHGDNYTVYYRTVPANKPLPATDLIQDSKINVPGPLDGVRPLDKLDTLYLYALDPQELNINVTAYAVQANGFSGTNEAEKALQAWNAVHN